MRIIAVVAAFVATLGSGMALAASDADLDACIGNDIAKSIAACTRIINAPNETTQTRATSYANRGIAYSSRREYDKAIADYDAALKLTPKDAGILNDRGNAWYAKRDIPKALADYDAAIAIDPKFAWPHNNRGLVLDTQGDTGKALAAYSEAIRLDPFYGDAFNNRGFVYEELADFPKALADYKESARLEPKSANPRDGIGTVSFKTGDLTAAQAALDEAVRLDPKVAQFYRDRGVVEVYSGAAAKALADFQKAAELAPANAYAALWLEVARGRAGATSVLKAASAKLDMGEWPAPIVRAYLGDLSVAALLSADRTPRRDCEAQFFVGQIALRRGARDEAVTMFRAAAMGCPVANIYRYAAAAELKAAGVTP